MPKRKELRAALNTNSANTLVNRIVLLTKFYGSLNCLNYDAKHSQRISFKNHDIISGLRFIQIFSRTKNIWLPEI